MKRRAGTDRTVSRSRAGSVRHVVPHAANDNSRSRPPMPFYVWSVYRAAARARYVGQVIAADADEAIEAAAVEFRTDAWKLIAVLQYAIA